MNSTNSNFRRPSNPITDPYAVEEQLARELQRRKVEEEKKRREIERICAASDEIKQTKHKVQIAYISKERSQQLAEAQVRRLNEIKDEAEIEATLLRKREYEIIEEQEKDRTKLQSRIQGREVLKNQMMEKYDATREAKEQYLKEKEQVNQVVQKLMQDDRQAFNDDHQKKRNVFQDMTEALSEKQEKVYQDKQREKAENTKYLDFVKSKDQQAQVIKIKKLEENAVKEQIFQKLKEEEERRRRESDMLTDLRFELYKEQYEAQERGKERSEQEKRERQKQEMQIAEKESREKKQREREQEQKIERDFKDAMMRKFASDDKLEQLAQQKRRMKEAEHKREVEVLWQEKLSQYMDEKNKEMRELHDKKELEKFHKDVIAQERDRILQEHLQEIGEFAPKGLLKNQQEAVYAQQQNKQQKSNYQQNFRLS